MVLPRSLDPATGQPITELLRGDSYGQSGTWEKLSIQMPSKLLQQMVPLLRSQYGSDVSPREAYVDLLVLNAYGGTGETEVWLDDLEVTGQVSTGISTDQAPAQIPTTGDRPQDRSESMSDIKTGLHGSVLHVNGRPRLVRAIDHNGEPFAWLKSIGFNAVRLLAPPSPEQLMEADESDVWLIVPSPTDAAPDQYGEQISRILAWDMGRDLTIDLLEPTRRAALQLRSAPTAIRRPIICQPRDDIWQYSRIADLVVLEPPGPNSSLALGQFGEWYLQRSRLTRLGTHFWATVPTEISSRIMEQMRGLGADAPLPIVLEPEQVELLAYHAIASGARGLLFRSRTRLDGQDRSTILRAKTLELINQNLMILDPWAAAGSHDGELDTGDPNVRASVLKTERSRMLLIIRRVADQQFVAAPPETRPITFEVPSVPETDEVYQIEQHGLRRIHHQRSTGVRVTLEETQSFSAVVLTQDRLVINFWRDNSMPLSVSVIRRSAKSPPRCTPRSWIHINSS